MKEAVLEFRGKIYEGLSETIGSTPLVRLKALKSNFKTKADIIGKLEFLTFFKFLILLFFKFF